MKRFVAAFAIALLAVPVAAQTLRFGLAEDPDVLDPTLARTFVGRIVFAALCDKLFDIDEKLNLVPQLAESHSWSADGKALTIKVRNGVTFHDGEKLDAAAVKYNIERHKNMPVAGLRNDNRFKVSKITEIGYQGITLNVGKSEQAKNTAIGKDPRVREAFELALDRDGIVQVVMEGEAAAGNQWVAPDNPFYAKNVPIPKRDVAKAKALLQQAGTPNPTVTLMTPTTSDAQKIAQVVQAMVKEAGFDVKIQSTEFATSLNLADKGEFDAYVLAWSGRADPDGNIYSFDACKQPLNYAGYCKQEVDDLLNKSRTSADMGERRKAYEQVAAIVLRDRPIVYLYHRHWLWAYNNKVSGLRAIPDGLVRVQGLKLN